MDIDRKKSFYTLPKKIRIRISRDPVGRKTPAVYLFGQTSDNQKSVLNRGKELWERGLVASILINDGETKHGYPGYGPWKKELLRMGVIEKAIVPLRAEILNEAVNTLTEAQALVRHARSQGWKRIYITAAPFHQLRAFITTVSVLLREYQELAVYSATGTALPLNETVRHSQGVEVATRREFVKREFRKIYDYHKKGDIVSPQEVLDYLNWRDKKDM